MNKPLPEVITDILTYNGAVADNKGNGSIEAIIPSDIAGKLNIPEYSILRFSYGDTSGETVYASYDSDFFNSIGNLFTGKGRLTASFIKPYVPNTDKIAKTIKDKVHFVNATFRADKTDTINISYVLVFFKYIAISDEKHEGILPLLIPCESCFYPQNGYYICDDKQHIICGNCFKECTSCGKQYCKACFKNRCPKCRK